MLLDLHALAPSAWLRDSMMAVVMNNNNNNNNTYNNNDNDNAFQLMMSWVRAGQVIMTTWKSYCLTHMLLVTLLACTISRAEDIGGMSRTGGRDQAVRAMKEKQQKDRETSGEACRPHRGGQGSVAWLPAVCCARA